MVRPGANPGLVRHYFWPSPLHLVTWQTPGTDRTLLLSIEGDINWRLVDTIILLPCEKVVLPRHAYDKKKSFCTKSIKCFCLTGFLWELTLKLLAMSKASERFFGKRGRWLLNGSGACQFPSEIFLKFLSISSRKIISSVNYPTTWWWCNQFFFNSNLVQLLFHGVLRLAMLLPRPNLPQGVLAVSPQKIPQQKADND